MRDAQEMARGLHIEEDRDWLRLIEMDLRGLLWKKMYWDGWEYLWGTRHKMTWGQTYISWYLIWQGEVVVSEKEFTSPRTRGSWEAARRRGSCARGWPRWLRRARGRGRTLTGPVCGDQSPWPEEIFLLRYRNCKVADWYTYLVTRDGDLRRYFC